MAAPDRIAITHQMTMTIPTPRAALERLLARLDETTDKDGPVPAWMDSYCTAVQALKAEPEADQGDDAIDRWIESRPDWPNDWPAVTQSQLTALIGEALEHWGLPTTPPALPPDFIDPEHAGRDRELLEAFYQAERVEGGTADECILRGLKAVLAARPAIPTTPPAPALGEIETPAPGRPNPSFTQFFDPVTGEVAVGLNLLREVVMKVFNSSYSASRAALMDALEICHAHKDGECYWEQCPQLRDGEPATTSRSCPLPLDPDDIERAELDALRRELEAGHWRQGN